MATSSRGEPVGCSMQANKRLMSCYNRRSCSSRMQSSLSIRAERSGRTLGHVDSGIGHIVHVLPGVQIPSTGGNMKQCLEWPFNFVLCECTLIIHPYMYMYYVFTSTRKWTIGRLCQPLPYLTIVAFSPTACTCMYKQCVCVETCT